jgi:hypothetical protein
VLGKREVVLASKRMPLALPASVLPYLVAPFADPTPSTGTRSAVFRETETAAMLGTAIREGGS